jgi:ribosomal protein S3
MKNYIKQIINQIRNKPLLIKPIVMPYLSSQNNGKKYKKQFLNYFDGSYEFNTTISIYNTFTMGVCKLEYEESDNKLTVYLRRPGLLIGKGGKTIDALQTYLDCKIHIIEVDLLK